MHVDLSFILIVLQTKDSVELCVLLRVTSRGFGEMFASLNVRQSACFSPSGWSIYFRRLLSIRSYARCNVVCIDLIETGQLCHAGPTREPLWVLIPNICLGCVLK